MTIREEGGWETAYFALVVAVDPAVDKPVDEVLKTLETWRPPDHLRYLHGRFLTQKLGERRESIRDVQRRVDSWRRHFETRSAKCDCPFCADLPHRRPIPGVCPVCGEEGAPELLERPETLGSSAGVAVEHGEK